MSSITVSMVAVMSNFRNAYTGVDLDFIFAARVSSPTSGVGFRNVGGVDLSDRYEKANSSPPTAPVGYRGPDGRDLSLWFSTDATGGLAINVSANNVSYDNGLSNSPPVRTMQAGAAAFATGGTGVYSYTWEIISSSGVTGVSLSTATGNNTTITATATLNIEGTVTVRCTVSDGVSTASATRTSSFSYYNQV